MHIETDEHGHMVVREVYEGLSFLTGEGNELSLCMRGDTFELELTPGGENRASAGFRVNYEKINIEAFKQAQSPEAVAQYLRIKTERDRLWLVLQEAEHDVDEEVALHAVTREELALEKAAHAITADILAQVTDQRDTLAKARVEYLPILDERTRECWPVDTARTSNLDFRDYLDRLRALGAISRQTHEEECAKIRELAGERKAKAEPPQLTWWVRPDDRAYGSKRWESGDRWTWPKGEREIEFQVTGYVWSLYGAFELDVASVYSYHHEGTRRTWSIAGQVKGVEIPKEMHGLKVGDKVKFRQEWSDMPLHLYRDSTD